MSGGNLANFATFAGGVQLGRELTFPDFHCGFLYASPDCTNQQKMKKILEGDVRRCAIWHGVAYIYMGHSTSNRTLFSLHISHFL